ncbi:MAG: hypothetical protein WDW36_000956 [Sanguina aurantia]
MLKNLTLPELESWCLSACEPLSQRVPLVAALDRPLTERVSFSPETNPGSWPLVTLDGGLKLQQVVRARDGTRKLVFKLTTGEGAGGQVEAVLIPVVRQAGLRDRVTLCVSSQVGCAMNCQFCYTGRMGLLGSLSTAQIIEQVVAARRVMAEEGDEAPLTNLVFMGMGEPLHNLEAVLAATDIMTHHLGLHMSHNKVTISTVGLVPELRQAVARSRAQIALSLHATTDEVRDWIAPINRRHPLSSLVQALRDLFPQGDKDGRTLLVEYVMLRGVNDTAEDAERLVGLLQDVRAKVNLIVFNPHAGTRFLPSLDPELLAFRSTLIKSGRVCTIRDSRGDDEMAACGQLGDVGVTVTRFAPLLQPPARFLSVLAPV